MAVPVCRGSALRSIDPSAGIQPGLGNDGEEETSYRKVGGHLGGILQVAAARVGFFYLQIIPLTLPSPDNGPRMEWGSCLGESLNIAGPHRTTDGHRRGCTPLPRRADTRLFRSGGGRSRSAVPVGLWLASSSALRSQANISPGRGLKRSSLIIECEPRRHEANARYHLDTRQ
jgi:hypothetical protein